jgi:hypothetical protein
MERTKYLVHVGGALLGQPTVRLELNDGTGRSHTFIRRKKEGETWTREADVPWVVDLDEKKARELVDSGYQVVPASAPKPPRYSRATTETEPASKRREKE